MMRPEFAMIGVLIGSIVLAAAVQSGRPRPEPVLTDQPNWPRAESLEDS